MENKPKVINYPDKLFFFLLLIQFSVIELEKGNPESLEVCGGVQADVTSK